MNNNMQITRLLMVETGTYNDLYMRPYTTQLNQHTLHAFTEATHGGSFLEPGNLSGVAGLILRPSTEARGQIQIPNGFNTKRFRFMMEVVINSGSHFGTTQQVQYLCGYTDQADVSLQTQRLDPRMRLHFNSSVITRRMSQMTPMGQQTVQSGREASHILTNRNDFVPSFGQQNQSLHMMRPQDVFYRMGVNGSMSGGGAHVDGTYDFRSILHSGKINKSKRSNSNTSNYLSNIMVNYRDMVTMADPAADYNKMMADAGGKLGKLDLMSTDPFLGQLIATRHTSFIEGGCISYEELCKISPGLDSIVDVISQRGSVHMLGGGVGMGQGNAEHWKGTNNETVMATILTQSVPALMMDLMLTKVAFMATNQTVDGQFMVQLTGGQSFAEGIDLSPYLVSFQSRLADEVMRELTQNNLIQINLQCEIDLLGDSRVEISCMGGPMVPFIMPSFCDALTVPVLAPDAKTLELLAHDISALGENISTDYSINLGGGNTGGGMPGPYNGNYGYNNANSSVL